jgi:hypothetical protein
VCRPFPSATAHLRQISRFLRSVPSPLHLSVSARARAWARARDDDTQTPCTAIQLTARPRGYGRTADFHSRRARGGGRGLNVSWATSTRISCVVKLTGIAVGHNQPLARHAPGLVHKHVGALVVGVVGDEQAGGRCVVRVEGFENLGGLRK